MLKARSQVDKKHLFLFYICPVDNLSVILAHITQLCQKISQIKPKRIISLKRSL